MKTKLLIYWKKFVLTLEELAKGASYAIHH